MSDYDVLGRTYTATRRADPRIRDAIWEALGDAARVVDVGAGTGSYEPPQTVLAVEPSATMIAQRPPGAAPAVQASAEAIPLEDDAVDAAMAILTIHHWSDVHRGLGELRRVARRRVVVLHWDQPVTERFWLLRDYLPQAVAYDRARWLPVDEVAAALQTTDIRTVPVPHDCQDGFAAAYWRRPHAYLDPVVRAGISCLAPLEDELAPGLARLRADLDSGAWQQRNAALLELEELDCGYRLVVAEL
jgi:SAM-dependent methyltransferase